MRRATAGDWLNEEAPSCGVISRLAVDPRSPGGLWTGGFGPPCHTPDNGRTLEPIVLQPGTFPDIADIEVDPADPMKITIAGARLEGVHPPGRAPLLYRSTDGGATWQPIETRDLQGTSIGHFAADRDDADVFYAATEHALYRSADLGASWREILFFGRHAGDVLTTPGAIYASRGASVLRSTDRGETWTPIRGGLGAREVERLWGDPRDPQHLFAGTSGAGLYEYTLPPPP